MTCLEALGASTEQVTGRSSSQTFLSPMPGLFPHPFLPCSELGAATAAQSGLGWVVPTRWAGRTHGHTVSAAGAGALPHTPAPGSRDTRAGATGVWLAVAVAVAVCLYLARLFVVLAATCAEWHLCPTAQKQEM